MKDKKEHYIDLLNKKIEEAEEIKKSHDESKITQWRTEVEMILENLILDPNSKYIKQFKEISYTSGVINRNPYMMKNNNNDAIEDGLNDAQAIIKSIIFGVQEGLL